MIRTTALFFAIAVCASGCSNSPSVKDAPVSVTGKVTQGGKPVGNLVVSFHPLDNGHLRSLAVKQDGTFLGEMIAGDYTYYVGSSQAPASAAVLKRIDPKYYEPDLGRSLSIESGKPIVLALD
jgi:hypothetical protein